MMNVQIMRHIVDPLVAGAMPAVAQRAVAHWRGEALVYVRSSANHIFRFTRDGQPYYLRLAHEQERNRPYIQAELDFVRHCAAAGLVVACPVLSEAGVYVEEIDSPEGHYYAVAFEGLQGTQYETDDLNEARYRAWGKALAHLHLASSTFPAHPVRATWQEEIRALLKTVPQAEKGLVHILESGVAWLDTLPIQDFGLIHGDFELDNLVWEGEQVQILDFDAAAYTWYAADIAIALQDVYFSRDSAQEERLNWFFAGYTTVYPLAEAMRKNVGRFLNLLLAVKITRLLQAYTTTYADTVYPDWLETMQKRHQNWLMTRRTWLKWD
ncbi:MAG: phosphotransferase [Chloroflexi bacterium]|nr:phosphotransferase [Chloroflexota bacterium]